VLPIWVLDTLRIVSCSLALAMVPASITAAFLRPRPWDERLVLLSLVGFGVLLAWAYLQNLGTQGSPGVGVRIVLLALITSAGTVGSVIYAFREWHRLRR
jgi:hypothetical protein